MSAQTDDGALSLAQRYRDTLTRIRDAERAHRRETDAVQLVAVSKTHPGACIRTLAGLGQRAFGESYIQEAVPKFTELIDLSLQWHFVGHIQSNKTRDIARLFDWVHSIDNFKVARRLSDARSAELPALQILLQVNIQSESSKSGIPVDALDSLVARVVALPRLRLRGLMAIPARSQEFTRQRQVFAQVRRALEGLNDHGFDLDCLSMGMTDDLDAAIAEGATHVRVGTAIFGPRTPKP